MLENTNCADGIVGGVKAQLELWPGLGLKVWLRYYQKTNFDYALQTFCVYRFQSTT